MSAAKSIGNGPSAPVNDTSINDLKAPMTIDSRQVSPGQVGLKPNHFTASNSNADANAGANANNHAVNDWDAAYDPVSNAWYYFNLVTGERSWDPPPGWVPNVEDGDGDVPLKSLKMYYYKDVSGITQGPFSIGELESWRGYLPMDLVVWWEGGGEAQQVKATLKDVLGDSRMPDDTVYALQSTEKEDEGDGEPGEPGLSFATLAEAALAGLKNGEASHRHHDDSQPCCIPNNNDNNNIDYAAVALRASGLGRVRAMAHEAEGKGGGDEALYGDMGSWVDPRMLQKQLAIAKEARQKRSRGLGRDEVRAIKQRRKEMKEKQLRSWLLSE
jgi:hypothetical protein